MIMTRRSRRSIENSVRFVRLIDLRVGSDLVGDGDVNSNEVESAQKQQRRSQLVGANVKAAILHVDVAYTERRILHLRRKRMRNGIAENAEPNWGIDISGNGRPVL
jgi:hypothetical protein